LEKKFRAKAAKAIFGRRGSTAVPHILFCQISVSFSPFFIFNWRTQYHMKLIHKIGIGILITIVVVMALGFWGVEKALPRFFYPFAPPMPPVVSDSMPGILAHLESVLKTNAPQVLTTLQPGISADQISRLEQQYHVQIPDDIQAIYEWHDGTVPMATTNYVEFVPIHRFVPLEEMLSEKDDETKSAATATPVQRAAYRLVAGQRDHWYCLFDDGAGDGYFFDPSRKPAEGALFCVFVEANDFTFFPSAKNLMAGIAKCYEQGAYRVKPGSPARPSASEDGPARRSPSEAGSALQRSLQLDEDYDQSAKIWKDYGVGNHPDE
jgi:cell wall assembly regulator SMI1